MKIGRKSGNILNGKEGKTGLKLDTLNLLIADMGDHMKKKG